MTQKKLWMLAAIIVCTTSLFLCYPGMKVSAEKNRFFSDTRNRLCKNNVSSLWR